MIHTTYCFIGKIIAEDRVDPLRSRIAFNVQSSSANPSEVPQTAEAQLSRHAHSLTLAMLSHHAVDALTDKETEGDEQEKMLAWHAKGAIKSGQLQLSTNLLEDDAVQFGMQHNHGMLVIKVKLNELSEYDVLAVGFRKGSEAPVTMTLPSPSKDVVGIARRLSLLSLPNELLLKIAGSTGSADEGVNLSLRRVNQRLKAIADNKVAPKQRFVIENGQALRAIGHRPSDMLKLASRLQDEQTFVLVHGETLQALEHSPSAMLKLASRPQDEQSFVLAHGETLKAIGHSSLTMLTLAGRPQDEQNFVLTHGETLQALAHDSFAMLILVSRPQDERNFVLAHGEALQAIGHSPSDMWHLSRQTQDEQDFVIAHGETLQSSEHSPYDMLYLATQPQDQRDFVISHGKKLHAIGHDPLDMLVLASRPQEQINAFLQQIYHRN